MISLADVDTPSGCSSSSAGSNDPLNSTAIGGSQIYDRTALTASPIRSAATSNENESTSLGHEVTLRNESSTPDNDNNGNLHTHISDCAY